MDPSGLILADDIEASEAANRLANELHSSRLELRVQSCSILVPMARRFAALRYPTRDIIKWRYCAARAVAQLKS
jgi:hypothetical protein